MTRAVSLSLCTLAVRPKKAGFTVATTVAEGDTGGHAGSFAQVTPGEAGYQSSENYNEN